MIVNKIQTEIETHKFYGKSCEILPLHVATNYLYNFNLYFCLHFISQSVTRSMYFKCMIDVPQDLKEMYVSLLMILFLLFAIPL